MAYNFEEKKKEKKKEWKGNGDKLSLKLLKNHLGHLLKPDMFDQEHTLYA